MESEKKLIAFDFDHTLIEENSDLYIVKLAPNQSIPEEIKKLYDSKGWTEFMRQLFCYLFQNSIVPDDLINCIKEISLLEGMKELLYNLKLRNYDIVIISDANSVFINTILENEGVKNLVSQVFTNPAYFDDTGCLRITEYHFQDWCSLCSKNLCKGNVLSEFIKQRQAEGVTYSQVVYIGDGQNDFCPSMQLSEHDMVFARKNYKLSKLLDNSSDKVRAKCFHWDSVKVISNELFDEQL